MKNFKTTAELSAYWKGYNEATNHRDKLIEGYKELIDFYQGNDKLIAFTELEEVKNQLKEQVRKENINNKFESTIEDKQPKGDRGSWRK